MTLKFIVPVFALLTLAAPAHAAGFDSAYTDLNLDDCTVTSADDFGSVWACPGYKGIQVYVAEGDLRMMVSYGFNAENEVAAGQTPPPFNTLGPKIEWRLSNASGGFKPIATIVRYLTEWDGNGPAIKGEVLVVTQLVAGQTCQIAYIDAKANADANQMARDIADKSGKFDCANDQIDYSKKFTAWENS